MTRERLYLFDTTLRDGAQMNGVDFTLHDKLTIAKLLDDLGVDYIEGGYPGANPTDTELFGKDRKLRRDVHGLRHDAAARALHVERSGACDPARRQGRRDLLRGEVVGLSRARRARDDQRGEPRLDPRQRDGGKAERPRGPDRLRAFLRRLQGQSGLRARLRQGGLSRRARAGSCCATPMAARCRTRSSASWATWSSTCRATMSASTPTTTPSRRWRTRSRRCAPARGRSRAR